MAAQPARKTDRPIFVEPLRKDQIALETQALIPVRQAYSLLLFVFTVVPILAGADKFFHFLTDWNQYLAPVVPATLGVSAQSFMMGAGIVEFVVGIGVAAKPRIFSYVVAAWLAVIIINLLILGQFYDIALRDFGLCLGALALARLSVLFDRTSHSV